MREKIENTYGKTLRGMMFAVNPIKKKIMKTHCTVHKYINIHALEILKNEGHNEAYEFFRDYIRPLNEGVTWADQDFKSSNHFYHFSRGTGLYGFSNALSECKKYYNIALDHFNKNNMDRALFYFGAVCHLIQDATVPQHVNNKLLESHRNFELWIVSKILSDYTFVQDKGIVRYKHLDDYIKNNALMANNTFLKSMKIDSRDERYRSTATAIIKEAQSTTAGVMLDFYDKIKN